MKKKGPSATWHHSPPKMFVVLFVMALLGFHYYYHIFLKQSPPVSFSPKIAFLFLVRHHLPLDFLWHNFFKNVDEAKFSIYVHSKPGFVFNESTTRSELFYDRQLKHSVKVEWGESSMIEAEKLLLKAALDDPANYRFVLLSDSCVPLYNFSYTYDYLMLSTRSFVDSFVSVKDGRYNPKMLPLIPENKWRKGSQWIALVRTHAQLVADDIVAFTAFTKFCKKLLRNSNCIPDEHYVPTLLTMNGCEDELERRTLTYTPWDEKSWHPMTFDFEDVSSKQMKHIKESRCNTSDAPCFLFARKFTVTAAMRLLMSHGLFLENFSSFA